MADLKISQLTSATLPLAGTEVLPIVQSNSTKKVATDDLTVKNVRSNTTTGILQVTGPAAGTTRVMTVPDANFTAACTDAAQTFSGDQSFSGNVLINTASVIGLGITSIAFSEFTNIGLTLQSTYAGTGGDYVAFFNSAGSMAGRITHNGTTTVVYGTSSDYRLKTVIGPVTGFSERIDALDPVEYEWKVDGSRTRGFLAHKFQEVYANSVTGSKDAVDAEGKPVYQSMQASTSEVIADLVAEIKSLRARVAALESN